MKLAVREGFEPSDPFSEVAPLAKECLRPLSHLTRKYYMNWLYTQPIPKITNGYKNIIKKLSRIL